MNNDLKNAQRLLLGHGALILLLGFIIGFGFLFFLLGEVTVWPFPGTIKYQFPGTYDAWRMAHLEGIANGLMLWIMAAVIPLLQPYIKRIYRISVGMIVVAWTFVIASAIDPIFPNARGLAFNASSNLASDTAFFLFYIGIIIAFVAVITIAVKTLRPGGEVR
ncbi:hypothetical protein R50073_02960 [Maricurvus nonylphenolicus]|uniref:hypothetical protein n=1 Tax=Maricurvus nonylphenolicus TaxID=1008307 RepID=UPI0036F35C58